MRVPNLGARRQWSRSQAALDSPDSAEHNSLFGEILDWMLAPLLFLWPISIIATHHVANNIANQPYDQALAENVRAIARLVKVADERPQVDFPAPARLLLHADEEDTVYFQVRNPAGDVVGGDNEIAMVPADADALPDVVYFRDGEIANEDVRVAYMFAKPNLSNVSGRAANPPRALLIQVAETRIKRGNLASRVVAGVLLPQFAIIPLAVILVYFGLGRGIAPLNRLQRLIRRRRPSDLSPISTRGVPEEVRPVVVAFNDMMLRLEQNLHAQRRFIGDAAHQMRTPLTGLKTQTELALAETDPALVHQALEHIAHSTDRTVHLINQLLALARAEAISEKVYAVEPVELEALVREVAQDFVPRALAKRIDFGVEVTGWPMMVDGNPLLLREMLRNLLDNAIKYTPMGGTVTARTRDNSDAIIEVEDTGIGVAASEREMVFERFYRVLGSGADGSGLGLAIVREIVELHRGTVVLDANPAGQGSVARVTLPRRASAVPALRADGAGLPVLFPKRT